MKKKPELFIKLVLSKKVSEMGGISQKHKLTIFAALLVPSHNSKQQQPKKPEAFFFLNYKLCTQVNLQYSRHLVVNRHAS